MKNTIIPEFNPPKKKTLQVYGSWDKQPHQFDEKVTWAIRAALAARRPLLIRGEPGVGKSQIARAAAAVLKWPLLYRVVNARYECEDLLYRFDAVARLAKAQVLGPNASPGEKAELNPIHFVMPSILWWAFDWESAENQTKFAGKHCGETAECYEKPTGWKQSPEKGCVVLIDEIDKAEAELPNGLLEALGNNGFLVPHKREAVRLNFKDGFQPPLVIITTNQERELPAAFLRRCLVMKMALPTDREELKSFLLQRAAVHFAKNEIAQSIREEAAEQLIIDRQAVTGLGIARPGQAEFLDILRALAHLHPGDTPKQRIALAEIKRYSLSKNYEDPDL